MLRVNILPKFRTYVVSQASRKSHFASARRVVPLNVCCIGGEKQLNVLRRSSASFLSKHKFCPPSSRCLSTNANTEEGNLIYTGSLGIAVRGVKMFSYSSSGASLIIMPNILLKTGLGVQSIALQAAFCGVIGFFTFLTPVLLHYITKGYVIRLYHHPDTDTYTAITLSVFLTEKRQVFHQNQVRIPAVSKMFTTFYAGNTGLLVNPDLFPVPHDYNHLMGYDKPFSFHSDDMGTPES